MKKRKIFFRKYAVFWFFRVIPKCDGEAIAAKFSCAFCETTAADDYEYVQQLFHRTVREVRKERERVVASNSIDEEPSSSSSSSSSIHFTISNETEKLSSIPNIPLPPPMPANLTQKPGKLVKPDSQTSISSLQSTASKSNSPSRTNNIPQTTTTSNNKRSSSKPTSVFSKIFK
jgi:hypothetical protein